MKKVTFTAEDSAVVWTTYTTVLTDEEYELAKNDELNLFETDYEEVDQEIDVKCSYGAEIDKVEEIIDPNQTKLDL